MNRNNNIDFIITWVDNSDEEWDKKRSEWAGTNNEEGLKHWNDDVSRYRDWGLLRYWFRGVEKYASWVNKVFFVTDDQKPDWLNTDHPKLVLVNHRDYIPENYLPTFNSHCIELNLHRIEELSDEFVYFNDDMYLIKNTAPEDFFKNGLPCDTAIMKPVKMVQNGIRAEINDMYVINDYFTLNDFFKNGLSKCINTKYGAKQISTLLMLPYGTIPGFHIQHLPISYNKETFEEVWAQYGDVLNETCNHKFRTSTDVNQWLMQYWQFMKGSFSPRSHKIGKAFENAASNEEILQYVKQQSGKMICINDSVKRDDFNSLKIQLQEAFASILPERAEVERY